MEGELFSEADLDQELIGSEKRRSERERQDRIREKNEEKERKKREEETISWDRTLFLLDGYSIIYKSYWAFISRPIMDADGTNISAYYGFFQTLFHILKENTMDGIAVTMDEKEPTFRHVMYPEYKATREKAPEDLHKSVPMICETLSKMGISVVSRSGYEADDVMASLAGEATANGWRTVIVSGDKDLCQLVSPSVSILRPPKKRGESRYTMMGREEVKAEYGVYPEQIVDYLTLIGDSADNVPGVSGIGEKSAARLLSEYVSLDGIYRHLDSLRKGERKKLEEGREKAELSRRLIVLSSDALPPGFDISSLSVSSLDPSRSAEDFEKRNLRSLAIRARGGKEKDDGKKADEENPVVPEEHLLNDSEKYLLGKGKYSIKRTVDEVEEDFEKITAFRDGVISLFLLMENEDPSSPAYGFAYTSEPLSAVFVPFSAGKMTEGDFIALSQKYFSTGKIRIITHDGKRLLRFLGERNSGCTIKSDTMILSWLVSSNDGIYTLSVLSGKYFSSSLLELSDIKGSGKMEDAGEDLLMRYCSLRADTIMRLDRVLSRRLIEKGLEKVYETTELPLMHILSAMEAEGIYLSPERMKTLKEKTDSRLEEVERKIFLLAGYTFNINSTMQLSKLLYEERGLEHGKKTMRGYSTDTATLESLSSSGDPVIPLLLEYRMLSKLKSTYIDVLPSLRDDNGRVHTTFLQTGTATGRLSSRNPNLQNIPVRTEEGRLIRSSFLPRKGSVFISADYSQIELVVLSWMSGDSGLREAFLTGEDVHRHTAASIFGKKMEDVTSAERRIAKTINFGIMYGMSAFRLAGELGISRSEASDFIKRYFERYSSVRTFVEKTVREAEAKGYVTTYWGHVRQISGINSRNRTEKAAAERTAVNTVIQGTAAEIMKKAMIDVTAEMKERGLKSKLILQVHDELIFEVPLEEKEEMERMVKEKMEGACVLSVPLCVSVESGESWGDMHN